MVDMAGVICSDWCHFAQPGEMEGSYINQHTMSIVATLAQIPWL
jgi:hypothetical protein